MCSAVHNNNNQIHITHTRFSLLDGLQQSLFISNSRSSRQKCKDGVGFRVSVRPFLGPFISHAGEKICPRSAACLKIWATDNEIIKVP
jgi:hypothetical protein